MSKVRIVDRHGHAITVDVDGTETTSEAAAALADFMREDVYFTGEQHPHNDAVRALLENDEAVTARAHREAQERLWAFRNETGKPPTQET